MTITRNHSAGFPLRENMTPGSIAVAPDSRDDEQDKSRSIHAIYASMAMNKAARRFRVIDIEYAFPYRC